MLMFKYYLCFLLFSPSFDFHGAPRFPECDPETEELLFRLVAGNDVGNANFLIDDENLTLSQVGKRKLLDSWRI